MTAHCLAGVLIVAVYPVFYLVGVARCHLQYTGRVHIT